VVPARNRAPRLRAGQLGPIGILACGLAACASGCSSSSGGPVGTEGTQAPDASPTGDTNPYGVAYPAQSPGYGARKGSVAGDQIPDYKLEGYPDSNVTGGLQTVSLADFYDPSGQIQIPGGALGVKIIHLNVAAVWCGPCNQETDEMVPLNSMLAQEGVVFLQALVEGPTSGVGATVMDLDSWIQNHSTTFTELLDPEGATLGQLFNLASIPFNLDIDARSMEILSSASGSVDVPGGIQTALAWVNANPPSYTAP
jgi:hypothetical protein